MAAPSDNYTVGSGMPIYGGRSAPAIKSSFLSVTARDTNNGTPSNTQMTNLPFVFEMHGSGGSNTSTGTQYRASVDGFMAFPGTSPILINNEFDSRSVFGYSLCVSYTSTLVLLRPIDQWYNDTAPNGYSYHESFHMGFVRSDGKFHLIGERRYDALLDWADKTYTQSDMTKRCATGGSMGGWGSASYAVRRYSRFAAVYPDRPRWNGANATIYLPLWDGNTISSGYTKSTAPLLADEDGGTSSWDYCDMVSYVANTANKVRWIGWCIGRQDGFSGMADQIVMVDTMRAAGRAFAFYWNNGGHSAGSSMDKITASYPYGTFRTNQGYPLFTSFSRDQDPRVQIAGGINIGLSFRNVVESATGWSCEITCVTPTTTTGNIVSASSNTSVSLPTTESEIPDVYVGGTITISGETRTINSYTPVGVSASDSNTKTPAVVTVTAPFSTVPAGNTAYSLTRPDVSCTVKVAPISDVFVKPVVKQTITIPAANTWVPVSFT